MKTVIKYFIEKLIEKKSIIFYGRDEDTKKVDEIYINFLNEYSKISSQNGMIFMDFENHIDYCNLKNKNRKDMGNIFITKIDDFCFKYEKIDEDVMRFQFETLEKYIIDRNIKILCFNNEDLNLTSRERLLSVMDKHGITDIEIFFENIPIWELGYDEYLFTKHVEDYGYNLFISYLNDEDTIISKVAF